ncbi:MAG TPA: ABC transporter ATP-binding protein [Acidimicrobiales bacterium]|nr:ABC transporter ATP-binding protein [Acidimicrobiales bacterium]
MAVMPDAEVEPVLAVCSLRRTYSSGNGVHDVSFDVRPGETVALLGPNGAGKTTTVRCIVGLMRPDAGSISVLGAPPGTLRAGQSTALVPDNPDLYPTLSVEEHLRFRAQAFRLPGPIDEAIAESMQATGIEEIADQLGGELSRGQRQRVMLAAAVLQRAALYVLDEPTVGLDPLALAWLEGWLSARAAAGAALLVATHQIDFMGRVADRAVLLQEGVVAATLEVPRGAPHLDGWKRRLVEHFDVWPADD